MSRLSSCPTQVCLHDDAVTMIFCRNAQIQAKEWDQQVWRLRSTRVHCDRIRITRRCHPCPEIGFVPDFAMSCLLWFLALQLGHLLIQKKNLVTCTSRSPTTLACPVVSTSYTSFSPSCMLSPKNAHPDLFLDHCMRMHIFGYTRVQINSKLYLC
jgi:hypothetical protein